jgi:hypothetical protein
MLMFDVWQHEKLGFVKFPVIRAFVVFPTKIESELSEFELANWQEIEVIKATE